MYFKILNSVISNGPFVFRKGNEYKVADFPPGVIDAISGISHHIDGKDIICVVFYDKSEVTIPQNQPMIPIAEEKILEDK